MERLLPAGVITLILTVVEALTQWELHQWFYLPLGLTNFMQLITL